MCMRQERKLYFSAIFLVMHPIAPAARLLGNKYALEPIEHCRRLVPRMTLTFLRWRLDLLQTPRSHDFRYGRHFRFKDPTTV